MEQALTYSQMTWVENRLSSKHKKKQTPFFVFHGGYRNARVDSLNSQPSPQNRVWRVGKNYPLQLQDSGHHLLCKAALFPWIQGNRFLTKPRSLPNKRLSEAQRLKEVTTERETRPETFRAWSAVGTLFKFYTHERLAIRNLESQNQTYCLVVRGPLKGKQGPRRLTIKVHWTYLNLTAT
jgi:hypothetical protein